MKEYWEITHDRGDETQAVWSMKPGFELNNLTITDHQMLNDSIEGLVDTRNLKEGQLTDSLSAKKAAFCHAGRCRPAVPRADRRDARG